MRKSAGFLSALLLLAALLLGSCEKENSQQESSSAAKEQKPLHIYVCEGCEIVNAFSYTGEFVEDGSDETRENIFALSLENSSETAYQLLEFKLNTSQGEFYFSLTSLFAGETISVLEKNGAEFPSELSILNAELINAAPFSEPPSLHEDKLEIEILDAAINIRNISDSGINNIYIYCKRLSAGEYFGGISYRIPAGSLQSGELRQLSVQRADKQTLKAVFVTYES